MAALSPSCSIAASAPGINRELDTTYELNFPPHVLVFEAEDILLQRDEPKLELLDLERAEDAEIGEDGGAESSHARDDEEMVVVLVWLRIRPYLFCVSRSPCQHRCSGLRKDCMLSARHRTRPSVERCSSWSANG